MSNKQKRQSFFWTVFSKFRSEVARTPLLKEYYENLEIMLSNNLLRLVFLVLDMVPIGLLVYLFSIAFRYAINITGQLILLLFFLGLLYYPAAYFYRIVNQLGYEISLTSSIYDARNEIAELGKPTTNRNYRSLQGKINSVRQNLKDFVEYSEILSPPIFNYELDRLQKRIDTFFNCASEVLVPINKLFSRAEEVEEKWVMAQYLSFENPPDEELLEMEAERTREMTGEIIDFDLRAMDEFMHYLWIALFEKETKRYSPLSFKHPVNLIVISRFFDRWNSVISSCSNCKITFQKASKDIDNYYKLVGKMERQRRQRILGLQDAAAIVIISVVLSTIVQYLIK